MQQFSVDERRARLGVRHHLAATAKRSAVAEVAGSLIGLHGTDPASIFLAAAARMKRPTVDAIEHALYEARTIVRMLAMRRTLFVVPIELVPIVQTAASNAVAANERKKLTSLVADSGVAARPVQWLRKVGAATLAALDSVESATAAELSKLVPELSRQIVMSPGKKWEAKVTIGSRLLLVLSTEGHIARGRPVGTWISTQHRWEPIDRWLPGGIEPVALGEARADLVTRWLRAFGPATVADLKWWTGWSMGDTRKALQAVDVVEVDLDGVSGIVLADDLEPQRRPKPWAALLPALDPTVMGWQDRRWFLGDHGPALFDRAGNAGPTVWWDGAIVGRWTQRKSGEIVWELLDDVGGDGRAAIEKEAARLEAWLEPTRITPRFGPRWTSD